MKAYKLTIAFTILFFLIKFQLNAQDSYSYILTNNGSNNYTVSAMPNSNTSKFNTAMQSYGFTIILPKNVKATIASSLGNSASATFFDGERIKTPSINGYLISGTFANAINLPAPASKKATEIATIQIQGKLTKESISILENNSRIGTEVTTLQSYLTADMIDDNNWAFTNVIDQKMSEVSKNTSYNFNSKEDIEVLELSIHPNPTNNIININSPNEKLNKIELYNSNGLLVFTKQNNLETIDINKLASGIYFMTLTSKNSKKTIKVMKK